MSVKTDKYGVTREQYLKAIHEAAKNKQLSSDVAAKLKVPVPRISQKIKEFKDEVEAADIPQEKKDQLFTALTLKDGRGRRKGDPLEKVNSLLALLDSDEDETETPE